jgi:uncharacterized beta-barrel protein YwiB (DUF1934 family)
MKQASTGQPIKVKVVTEMRNGPQTETMTQHSKGMRYLKGNTTYLRYEEKLAEEATVDTTVKVSGEDVTVIRKGAVTMKQLFRKHEVTFSTYRSVHGPMEMETKTDMLKYEWNERKASGKLTLSYMLTLQGEQVGRHKLTFLIEEV